MLRSDGLLSSQYNEYGVSRVGFKSHIQIWHLEAV